MWKPLKVLWVLRKYGVTSKKGSSQWARERLRSIQTGMWHLFRSIPEPWALFEHQLSQLQNYSFLCTCGIRGTLLYCVDLGTTTRSSPVGCQVGQAHLLLWWRHEDVAHADGAKARSQQRVLRSGWFFWGWVFPLPRNSLLPGYREENNSLLDLFVFLLFGHLKATKWSVWDNM